MSYIISTSRQRRRVDIVDIVPDDTNDNTNNSLWKLLLPILRQCSCQLLSGRTMTTRTRRQHLIFTVVLRRILVVFCFLSLYYTVYYQLEKHIIENNYNYYRDNNETMMMMTTRTTKTTTATVQQRNINRQKDQQPVRPDTKPSSIRSTSGPLTTINVLSLYLTTPLLTDTVADNDNDNITSTNLTLQEARKGREPILSILEDAGIDIDGSDPIDVIRLPMWSSVANLYYNGNSKNENNSNRSFPTDDINAAATDNDDDKIDNYGPVIVGLETCEIFRKRVKPLDRLLGIAGNFNSGTTAFATTLQNNCHIPGHNKNKNGFIIKEKDIKNSNGILSQVPWRKHKMAQYRDMYIMKNNNENTGNSNHTTTTTTTTTATTNSNNNNNIETIKGKNVLPIVLIRDPFHWMQSMCKEGYGVRWDHDSKYHCPNLIPNEFDKRRYNKDNWYKYNNDDNNTKTKKKHDNATATNSSSSIQVWMGPNPQVGPSWPSLIHYWNEWYESYLFHNFNNVEGDEIENEEYSSFSYWPRIIIRFEDTLFYPRQVIEKVCHCGGGKLITNSKNDSNNNSTMNNNGKTIIQGSNSNNNEFIYNINESKPNHNNNIEHNNFITAIIKYGGTNNNNDIKRVQNMTLDDIQFAVKTVNPKLMNIFQYTYPTYRTVPNII